MFCKRGDKVISVSQIFLIWGYIKLSLTIYYREKSSFNHIARQMAFMKIDLGRGKSFRVPPYKLINMTYDVLE